MSMRSVGQYSLSGKFCLELGDWHKELAVERVTNSYDRLTATRGYTVYDYKVAGVSAKVHVRDG